MSHFPQFFPVRQLSQNAGKSECVYCKDSIGGLEKNIGDLRLGCDCLIHYTCLIEYFRFSTANRQGAAANYWDFAREGIKCPVKKCQLAENGYILTLGDLDQISCYDLEVEVDQCSASASTSAARTMMSQEFMKILGDTSPLTREEVDELRRSI